MPALAHARSDFSTGVSDDRLSLPEGPGSLEGIGENVNVDANMGTMRWSIPIDVPEGFDGVTPTLALSYSSGNGSSVVGVGWMFDVPAVERMTARGLPDYDEDDLFVAGGDELVRVSPANLNAGSAAVYRSRFERNFTRWSWVARDGGRNGFFKAEYNDGRVGFFGADVDGTSVAAARVAGAEGTFRYLPVDVVDVYGHRLHYTWVKDGAESLLSRIEWVFGAAGARYRVDVAYEDRDDPQSDCKPGFEAALTKRVTSISVFSQNQRIRRYVLQYDDYDDAGGQSRLARVETRGKATAENPEGELYPIVQSFAYSRALGAACPDDACGRPTLVSMGNLGVSLRDGKATLIDMNGDALPDVVDTNVAGGTSHRFFFNELASDGAQGFSAPVLSAVGTTAGHALGTRPVQVIDEDGDGFSDIINALTGEVLVGDGGGDWAAVGAIALNNNFPSAAEDNALRFIDVDNDKRIDALRSDNGTTTLFHNNGAGSFDITDLAALGVSFADENIELSDMNGDGLLDLVRMRRAQLSYRLNLGHGDFAAFVDIDGLDISDVEDDVAQLEDMNGDGLADVVIVTGNVVKYLLNRNGARFDAPVVVESSAVVGGSIPERLGDTVVLTADMNGNGSSDIVWIEANGAVTYLDLFPVRPHLLTHIENGIGRVTDIDYSTSVLEAARALEEGTPWVHQVPFPMTVVTHVDETDLLSQVHDVSDHRYFDGFYDGVERVYRGYERVVASEEGDEHQEGAITTSQFDVGVTDPWRAGLKLSEDLVGAGADGVTRAIRRDEWDFDDCDVAEVPSAAELLALGRQPVRRVCEVASRTILKEGQPESAWVTTATRTVEDGYGNVVDDVNEGVVGVDGDERYESRSFVPTSATGGLWITGAVVRERVSALPGPAIGEERITYYDGTPFVGLPEGTLSKGDVTRISERVDDSAGAAAFEDVTRQRFDAHGQVVESLDPLGVVGGDDHRRSWVYDDDGLQVLTSTLHLTDDDGAAYTLVKRVAYDDAFDLPVQATAWVRVVDDVEVSPRNEMFFAYDGFGRVVSRVRPGDSLAAPTEAFAYNLGSPVTSLVTTRRTQAGGAADLQQVACLDGRGRTYQTRTQVNATTWQVDGFVVFNLRGERLRVSQPYVDVDGVCDTAAPADVLASTYVFDAANRLTRVEHPDGAVFATRYEPLTEVRLDPSDLDDDSAFVDTPIVVRRDGLMRVSRLERHRVGAEPAVYAFAYDAQTRLAGYTDPLGNEKTQSYDLRGRVVAVDDPNAGLQTFSYDAASNPVRRVDARGVVVRAAYDGQNRLIERWNEIDRDGTLVRAHYDVDASCDVAVCSNTAGLLTTLSYPAGSERFGYDARGNALLMGRTLDGVDYDTHYSYDHADRVVRTVHPDGRAIDARFDGAGRVTAYDGIVDNIRYDARDQVAAIEFHSGVTETRGYDERMRQSSVRVESAATTLLDLTTHYDGVGNVVRVEDALDINEDGVGLSLDAENGYDEWHRLVSQVLGAAGDQETSQETVTLAYDVLDRTTSSTSTLATSAAQVGAFTYDAAPLGAVSRAGDRSYAYDDAGNMTARGDVSFTWDHMGRLTSATRAGARPAEFSYGAAEQRVGKREAGGVVRYASGDFEVKDGVSVTYLRVRGERIARLSSSAIATRVLTDVAPRTEGGDVDGELNAGDAYVASTGAPGASDPGDLLLAAARRLLLESGPDTVALSHDTLGSAVLATGPDGSVVGRQSFHAFGETRAHVGYVDDYGFTGQERDDSTGLIHLAHRSLDPTTGRFASVDPSFAVLTRDDFGVDAEFASAYAYVNNNPTTFTDPSGLRLTSASRPGAKAFQFLKSLRAPKFLKNFAAKHPRIATALRVGVALTGLALSVASIVATGGAAASLLIIFAAGSTTMDLVRIAQQHSMLTSPNPKIRAMGQEKFAKGIVSGVLGIGRSALGLGGVFAEGSPPNIARSAVFFGAETVNAMYYGHKDEVAMRQP